MNSGSQPARSDLLRARTGVVPVGGAGPSGLHGIMGAVERAGVLSSQGDAIRYVVNGTVREKCKGDGNGH